MPLLETKGAGSAQGFGLSLGGEEAVYIEDVFSTYLYTGTGASLSIVNGIDLSTEGGLVWTKSRSDSSFHKWYDSARGISFAIESNTTDANQTEVTGITSFNTNGYTYGTDGNTNSSGTNYASWTFRKQPKFFDVVTYTGNNVTGRTIAHNLGSVPGCIIVKRTESSGDWAVYHRGVNGGTNPQDYKMILNLTNAQGLDNWWNNTPPTSSSFQVSSDPTVNAGGATYVAYLFAHNAGGFGLTGLDNVISCGLTTANGSGDFSVNLGYEPQWVLIKSTGSGRWSLFDNMRGVTASSGYTSSKRLQPHLSDAEDQLSSPYGLGVNETGFTGNLATFSNDFIYIAIRRGPMKVPTSGTEVFATNTETEVRSNSSNWTSLSGFPVDLFVNKKVLLTDGTRFIDRLRTYSLTSSNTDAEVTAVFATFDTNNGVKMGPVGLSGSSTTYADYLFQRAPGFFDVVCYTGDGVSGRTLNHNLTVTPELFIIKSRNITNTWNVQTVAAGWNKFGYLSSDQAFGTDSFITADPTSTALFLQSFAQVNGSGNTYVAYLFATLAGVSKVGSYTGTGTTQTINCGFTAGSRFVMIKRTDSTGDWYVWDSARGIVAGNDPHLSLNTTAAEVTTDDSVDTDSTGFVVNQVAATNINVSSATYIFLAVA